MLPHSDHYILLINKSYYGSQLIPLVLWSLLQCACRIVQSFMIEINEQVVTLHKISVILSGMYQGFGLQRNTVESAITEVP